MHVENIAFALNFYNNRPHDFLTWAKNYTAGEELWKHKRRLKSENLENEVEILSFAQYWACSFIETLYVIPRDWANLTFNHLFDDLQDFKPTYARTEMLAYEIVNRFYESTHPDLFKDNLHRYFVENRILK